MNILHIIPTFYPATKWGGPIFSTLSLCNALHNIDDINLMVLTTNAAAPDSGDNIPPAQLSQNNIPYDIIYCHRIAGDSISLELLMRLKEKIQWADVVHLTAIYSFPTIPTLFLSRIFQKPVVWTPRGSLQRWKGTNKPGLKFCWEHICKAIVNPNSCCVHVTSLAEEMESRKIFPHLAYRLITNGIEIPDEVYVLKRKKTDRLQILYIGRIDPKKGIENLLKALSLLSDVKYHLTLCGTGETKYLNSIKAICASCGIDNNVHFAGHLDGQDKFNAFLNSDICIVPSHIENFGMVVAEALAHGIPVICSKGAPWSGLDKHGCGIWTDNDPNSLAQAIGRIRTMDLPAMGRRGRQWMASDFNWSSIANKMIALYREMVSH